MTKRFGMPAQEAAHRLSGEAPEIVVLRQMEKQAVQEAAEAMGRAAAIQFAIRQYENMAVADENFDQTEVLE